MEPLKPIVRDALKEANPGLKDETIDRCEELLAQRFLIDPEAEPLRVAQLDRERALLQKEFPNFEQVIEKVQGRAPVAGWL
ncbi:MAG TPA: hypothetical protein VKA15_01320 [Isosphaeraceae bacterium]|nr:hypothetical protein [Isosphaeraceae bacterium]